MNNSTPAIRTTCPYCGVGCGVLAVPDGQGGAAIQGDPEHPANRGRLCSKGTALGDTLGLSQRLLYPEVDGQRVSWAEALDRTSARLRDIIQTHGPDAVAFYVSGQLLTEDYYVANKLMKGFIGSANIDTNSRLCMSSTVAGHKRAFGFDTVPGSYEDLELADLIVLVGSNTAWCHPVLFQRIQRRQRDHAGCKVVVIDPRATATAEAADLYLSLKPGSDALLFNGLLAFLQRENLLDQHFLERHTRDYTATLEAAQRSAPSISAVAAACGLTDSEVATFYRWFADTEKTVTLWSQGINQSSSGVDKVNAILNVHLATGRIGRPGRGPLSLTGQPNAMGGREVGGLANQLAAHLEWNEPDRRLLADFWKAPRLAQKPGLKAVDMFRAIGTGRIKAVWIMATNPVVSLPDLNSVQDALRQCELVIVSDCSANTDLNAYAHVRFPALAWGEKDGTVTNSERRISRQRPFLDAPGEAKPDWWVISQVALRLGYGHAFAYESPAEIFREHARLSGFSNAGRRPFNIAGLAGLDTHAYNGMQPVQWPAPPAAPYGTARLYGDGFFFSEDNRARLIPITPREPAELPDNHFNLTLNTGRVRDHWHTLTRTALSPRLCRHSPEPYAELHPSDALPLGVSDGSLVRLTSRYGNALARAKVTRGQRPGSVFMPMHWTQVYAKAGLVNRLVNPHVDPISGEPEFKATPVTLESFAAEWYGFVFSRPHLDMADAEYQVMRPGADYQVYEVAGTRVVSDWATWSRHLTRGVAQANWQWLEFHDRRAGRYRAAVVADDRVEFCVFIGADFRLPPRDWLERLFEQTQLSALDRAHLLAGRPAKAEDDAGPTVCACFGVGRHSLTRAIAAEGLTSVEQIGAHLQAGTGCGSCVPELKTLLAAQRS